MQQYTGGLTVTSEMLRLSNKSRPGQYLTVKAGGQRLRDLYSQHSEFFNPVQLSPFGMACAVGEADFVRQALRDSTAPPDLKGKETPYRWSYVTLTVCGAQRVVRPGTGHVDVLNLLLDAGAPTEEEDICGYTALHHASINNQGQDVSALARLLVQKGKANVNHQDKFGCVALTSACMSACLGSLEVLMEGGALLDIKDADGCSPMDIYPSAGGQVVAIVEKWRRKRSNAAPMARETDTCNHCGATSGLNGAKLLVCSRCKLAHYCNATCQRGAWPQHKKECNQSEVVILRPTFSPNMTSMSMADMARRVGGMLPHEVQTHEAKCSPGGKNFAIKVQLPLGDNPLAAAMGMLVYDRKRKFQCNIIRKDCPDAYDRVAQVVRSRGLGGVKAYFMASIPNEKELQVNIKEVLAPQPF